MFLTFLIVQNLLPEGVLKSKVRNRILKKSSTQILPDEKWQKLQNIFFIEDI